jgi:hypothetical protein
MRLPRLKIMSALALAIVAAGVPTGLAVARGVSPRATVAHPTAEHPSVARAAVAHAKLSRAGPPRAAAARARPRHPGPSSPAPSSSAPTSPAPSSSAPTAPAAVEGFDESGVSTGLGDDFSTADWTTIKDDGFKLFITDPIEWSSECSDGNCADPVNTCTIDPAAVAQIQDAYNQGIDYAVYTRNVNCLTAAIQGLSSTLQAHLSFAVLDIEPGPSVPLTKALINAVTSLGQTPVVYSYQSGWRAVMGGNSSFSSYPLQDGEVPNWGVQFPAAYPSGYPALVPMPNPYGGWSGYDAQIEQQQCCTDIQGPAGAIDSSSDQVDLDAVNSSWLSSLPHGA